MDNDSVEQIEQSTDNTLSDEERKCRQLFLRVILYAKMEALGKAPIIAWEGKQAREAARLDAMKWLTTPSRDLSQITSLAGVDMRLLVEYLRKLFNGVPDVKNRMDA